MKIIQLDQKKTFIYYREEETDTLYISRKIYEVCIKSNIELASTPKIINDRNYYSISLEKLKELEEKENYKGIEMLIEKEDTNKVIIGYQDVETKNIYIGEEDTKLKSSNSKIILGKKCYLITPQELNETNQKIVIIPVFINAQKPQNIIIAKSQNQSFIEEEIAQKYSLDTSFRKKIRIEGKNYVEATEEELLLIKIISNKEDHRITFETRNIVLKS